MSKQRPSAAAVEMTGGARPLVRVGVGRADWARRVFKNSYTRGGRRTRLRGWSVKFQHQGTRRTFSLAASTRDAAAIEAQAIYQTLVTEGWDAAVRAHSSPGRRASLLNHLAARQYWPRTDLRYWKQRVVVRRYASPLRPGHGGEYSARIEHAGMGCYFPLGTLDADAAAGKAREIYLALLRDGWDTVNRRFQRELTVAVHWADNPLAWTYATFHSVTQDGAMRIPRESPRVTPPANVVVVEPDESVRRALFSCIHSQSGFACTAAFAHAKEALRDLTPASPDLALVNRSLRDDIESEWSARWRRVAPHLSILFYAVYEDSDQLFKATPGGATGYLLKRTPPDRLFEPIAEPSSEPSLTLERIALRVRRYFQNVILTLSAEESARDMAKLTHREHDILNLLSKGYVDKEIAEALRISVWTVHGHLKKVFEKLGVHTRTEAAVKYLHK